MAILDPSTVYARLPGLSANRMAAVPGLVAAAESLILSHLRRPIEATDYDATYRVGSRDTIRLHYPVITLTGIFVDESTVNDALDPDRYRLDAPAGVLTLMGGYEARVVYRAGYEPGAIPAAITEAGFLIVQGLLENLPDGAAGGAVAASGPLASVSLGDYSESYQTGARGALGYSGGMGVSGMPPVAAAMLSSFRDLAGAARRW